jgi:hypothetical protein
MSNRQLCTKWHLIPKISKVKTNTVNPIADCTNLTWSFWQTWCSGVKTKNENQWSMLTKSSTAFVVSYLFICCSWTLTNACTRKFDRHYKEKTSSSIGNQQKSSNSGFKRYSGSYAETKGYDLHKFFLPRLKNSIRTQTRREKENPMH